MQNRLNSIFSRFGWGRDSFDASLASGWGSSLVITSYNRSPYCPKGEMYRNPLAWLFESVAAQRMLPSEVVIVNDASSDYTSHVIGAYSEQFQDMGVRVRQITSIVHRGQTESRHIAFSAASNDTVMLSDDDCYLSPHFISGGLCTYAWLKRNYPDTAALQMPVYFRDVFPTSIARMRDIGVLDFSAGRFVSNFDRFPAEYLMNGMPLTGEGVIRPMEITNLAGVFIGSRSLILRASLPDYFTWKNGYSEESELAARFASMDLRMFFTPDPRFSAVHFKYGYFSPPAGLRDNPLLFDGIRLSELNNESNLPREKTGDRVDAREWWKSRIMSFYVLFLLRSEHSANLWVRRQMDDFVRAGGKRGQPIVDSFSERNKILSEAVKEGRILATRVKERESRGISEGCKPFQTAIAK